MLLVDHDEINHRIFAGALRSRRYEVDVLSSGEDAIRAVRTAAYDVVLLRCELPAPDGFATARLVRDAVGAPSLRILGLTSAPAVDRRHCEAAGMDDVLAMPVRVDAMLDFVSRWAGEEPAAPALAAPDTFATDPAPSPIDDAMLRSMRSAPGGERVLQLAIDAYRTTAPLQLERLGLAAEADDHTTLRFVAHTLKSSSAMLGVTTLAALLRRLEGEAFSLDRATRLALVRESHRAFQQAEPVLQTYVTP